MEIRVKVKFYNENFKKALNLAGFKSLLKFSRKTKISYQRIIEYAGFGAYPRKEKILKKLEKSLRLPREYLFPEEYKIAVDKKLGKKREIVKQVSLLKTERLMLASPSPLEHVIKTEKFEALAEALKTLPGREQEILKDRFGIGTEEKTLREIGNKFGVSQGMIRVLEARAIKKLRDSRRRRALAEFLV